LGLTYTCRNLTGRRAIPFAETKEQIGGFILIAAQDLNEALQMASGIPVIRLGGVEVRPIKELTNGSAGV